VKVIFYQTLSDFQKNIAFGGFQGFACLSFWLEHRVDEMGMERWRNDNDRRKAK
jgi:hypothetical protein